MSPDEIVKAYAEQIIAHVRNPAPEHTADAQWLVEELIREFGAKAYRSGQADAGKEIARICADRFPQPVSEQIIPESQEGEQ